MRFMGMDEQAGRGHGLARRCRNGVAWYGLAGRSQAVQVGGGVVRHQARRGEAGRATAWIGSAGKDRLGADR